MTMKNRHKVFGILQHVVLIILAVYTLAPLAFLVVNAFKSNNEIVSSPVSLPSSWSFQYVYVLYSCNADTIPIIDVSVTFYF